MHRHLVQAAFRSKLEKQEMSSRTHKGSSSHQIASRDDEEGVLDEGESQRVQDWLSCARDTLQRADSATALDRIIADGELLRASIYTAESDSDSSEEATPRRKRRRADSNGSNSSDQEATSLLVDFLNSVSDHLA